MTSRPCHAVWKRQASDLTSSWLKGSQFQYHVFISFAFQFYCVTLLSWWCRWYQFSWTMLTLKMTARCSFGVDRRFRGAYCIIALMMDIVLISETSAYFDETTRCYITKFCHSHTSRRENLKSHKMCKIEMIYTSRVKKSSLITHMWRRMRRGGIAPTH
jgi:hypothetical protein